MKPTSLLNNMFLVRFVLTTAWKLYAKSKIEIPFENLTTPKHVDIPKYMGRWYVIANIPSLSEKDVHNAIESYSWNEKEQRVDINFTYNKGNFDGESVSLKQDAYIRNRKTNNDWRVRLSNGVKLPYTIMEVAHDYSYSIVGLPNREQVWILSRESTMHDSLYNSLKGRIQDEGFDISQLQKVPQTVFH